MSDGAGCIFADSIGLDVVKFGSVCRSMSAWFYCWIINFLCSNKASSEVRLGAFSVNLIVRLNL